MVKGQKAGFLRPIRPKITLTEEKEENHNKSEEKEMRRRRRKVMFALLVFILVTLEKKLLDTGRGIFGSNVFKNQTSHVIIVVVAVSLGKNRRVIPTNSKDDIVSENYCPFWVQLRTT